MEEGPGLSEQQQTALQHEERILTAQIESLQKEKYDSYILIPVPVSNHYGP